MVAWSEETPTVDRGREPVETKLDRIVWIHDLLSIYLFPPKINFFGFYDITGSNLPHLQQIGRLRLRAWISISRTGCLPRSLLRAVP